MRRSVVMLVALLLAGQALASTTSILAGYARDAPGGFSAARGRTFYTQEHRDKEGRATSCATCHGADPAGPGRTRANKVITPLAPSANPQRLTDLATVEKWFTRNCQDVLQRPCTAQEKGDFITYLQSVR